MAKTDFRAYALGANIPARIGTKGPILASKLPRLKRINQMLDESRGPEYMDAQALNAHRKDYLEKLKMEEEKLKNKIKAAENSLNQAH
jgi:hypothetical protein